MSEKLLNEVKNNDYQLIFAKYKQFGIEMLAKLENKMF